MRRPLLEHASVLIELPQRGVARCPFAERKLLVKGTEARHEASQWVTHDREQHLRGRQGRYAEGAFAKVVPPVRASVGPHHSPRLFLHVQLSMRSQHRPLAVEARQHAEQHRSGRSLPYGHKYARLLCTAAGCTADRQSRSAAPVTARLCSRNSRNGHLHRPNAGAEEDRAHVAAPRFALLKGPLGRPPQEERAILGRHVENDRGGGRGLVASPWEQIFAGCLAARARPQQGRILRPRGLGRQLIPRRCRGRLRRQGRWRKGLLRGCGGVKAAGICGGGNGLEADGVLPR